MFRNCDVFVIRIKLSVNTENSTIMKKENKKQITKCHMQLWHPHAIDSEHPNTTFVTMTFFPVDSFWIRLEVQVSLSTRCQRSIIKQKNTFSINQKFDDMNCHRYRLKWYRACNSCTSMATEWKKSIVWICFQGNEPLWRWNNWNPPTHLRSRIFFPCQKCTYDEIDGGTVHARWEKLQINNEQFTICSFTIANCHPIPFCCNNSLKWH